LFRLMLPPEQDPRRLSKKRRAVVSSCGDLGELG
jgi:hypothetical protein